MERFHYFAFLLYGVLISGVLSLPYSNFSIDCETMATDVAKAEESISPYHITVTVSSEEYVPGSEVKVNIEGSSDAGFKWFMLQARDVEKNTPIGSFIITDPNTQSHDCYSLLNSTLVHNGSDEKYNITSLWVSQEAKKVQFVATVFQEPEKYWVVISDKILYPNGSNVTGHDIKVVDEANKASASPRSRKKSSAISVRINCGQGGSGSYGSSSGCATGSTYPSQSSSSQQGGLVYSGGRIIQGGCIGGGTASVYNKYGCTDPGVDTSGGISYGQSVSTVSDKGKVVVYPPTGPFPPERHTYTSQLGNSPYKNIQSTKYGDKIYSQGSSSGKDISITIQDGQPVQVCDKTSSSYNSPACKVIIQSGGSSVSQSGTSVTYGGGRPSASAGDSGTSIIISEGRPSSSISSSGSSVIYGGSRPSSSISSSGSSVIYGGSRPSTSIIGGASGSSSTYGSSTSIGSNPCGQGQIYNGRLCKPVGIPSQHTLGGGSQVIRNPCDGTITGKILSDHNCPQGAQSGSYGSSGQYGQGGQSVSYGSSTQYGKGGPYGSSSQYGQVSQTAGGYGRGCDGNIKICRRKRAALMQDAFNSFISKIQGEKALAHTLSRRNLRKKVQALIRTP